MTSAPTIANASTTEIPRDGWGRPLIKPVGGGKAIGYTRATTMASTLEDTYNLGRWQLRMAVLGLVRRPHLLRDAEQLTEDDRGPLNAITSEAIEASGANDKRERGTLVHALTELRDAGQPLGDIAPDVLADVDAYSRVTQCLDVLHTESFVVVDGYRVAGTPDRIVEFEGERYIADIKTGNIDYASGSISIQLGIYAHGQFYDPATGARTPLPGVNGQRAIVIHVPPGGRARLVWVDIAAGWDMTEVAFGVRRWRNRRDLFAEFDAAGAIANLVDAGLIADEISAQIEAAPTAAALVAVWDFYRATWTDAHTALAATRKATLTGGS